MIEVFRCIIWGEPVGKGSIKVSVMDGGGKARPFANRYYGEKTKDWMALAIETLRGANRQPSVDGPLHLDLTIVVGRPKRLEPKFDKRGDWKPKSPSMARIWCTEKPDSSNVLKGAEDALTQAGVIKDDKFLVSHTIKKFYAAHGEQPHVEVVVSVL